MTTATLIPPVETVLTEIAARTDAIEHAKAERRLLLDQLRVSEGARRQENQKPNFREKESKS